MDADIQLPQTDTLARMVTQMQTRPELRVFNSRPVKDVLYFDLKVGPISRLIVAGGDRLNDFREAICGQLFILRGSAARQPSTQVGARLREAHNLEALFSADLDFLVLFSSNAAESGGLGQVDQAAACGFLAQCGHEELFNVSDGMVAWRGELARA